MSTEWTIFLMRRVFIIVCCSFILAYAYLVTSVPALKALEYLWFGPFILGVGGVGLGVVFLTAMAVGGVFPDRRLARILAYLGIACWIWSGVVLGMWDHSRT